MRVVRTVGGLVLLSVLAGCVSPEEQHAADQQRCYGYGFQPGTDQFADCMMATSMRREDQEVADRRAFQRDQDLKAQQNAALEAQAKRTDLPACQLSDPE